MIGKTLTARVIFLILAVLLYALFWYAGVPSEIMLLVKILVVIRIVFLLTMVLGKKG